MSLDDIIAKKKTISKTTSVKKDASKARDGRTKGGRGKRPVAVSSPQVVRKKRNMKNDKETTIKSKHLSQKNKRTIYTAYMDSKGFYNMS